MMAKPMRMKVLCWICIVLTLSTCTRQMCFAQAPDSTQAPDSSLVEPQIPGIYDDVIPIQDVAPTLASDDTLTVDSEDKAKTVYKKWWVLAIVAVAIAVVTVLVAGNGKETAKEELPDFPEPPER